MGTMQAPPEGRTTSVAASVTPSERDLVKLVSLIRKSDVSTLLRSHSLNDLLTEGERIAARLRDEAA